MAVETIGSLTPASYTGKVTIQRKILDQGLYQNSTNIGGLVNYPDISADITETIYPQSGGSGGKVYDLDGPGPKPSSVDGMTYRYRTNFSTWAALPSGKRISPIYNFYVRVSCTKTASGHQFVNDVTGDNQIGPGTTNTTWDLQ